MRHRHLNHENFTLAAIDDIIGRGRLSDWDELRAALLEERGLGRKIIRVCDVHVADPYAQRYHFWKRYAKARSNSA